MANFFVKIINAISNSYIGNFVAKSFTRLRVAVMNPFRRMTRRVQQMFNANMVSARLASPINEKIRKIMGGEAKSEKDYVTIGNFWISKMLIYIVILAACAFVFIYFSWINPASKNNTTETSSRLTDVTYSYDDMKLGEYSGKANIEAENGTVVYTGDIAQGMCTGLGTLWNQSGVLVYEGEFLNNEFSGSGKKYYANGSVMYEGSFASNSFSGDGIMYYATGALQYVGSFENGAFSGEGMLYAEDGTLIYEGSFKNGVYHGAGTSYYISGARKYSGEFSQGMAQGAGILYSSAGQPIFEGSFIRDNIQYEALAGQTLEYAAYALKEEPTIFYSGNSTCFLFKNAKVIIKTDSKVEMLNRDSGNSGSGSWYLPNDTGETLPESSSTTADIESSSVGNSTSTVQIVNGNTTTTYVDPNSNLGSLAEQISELPARNNTTPYIYLPQSDSWMSYADLVECLKKGDKTGITITEVCTYSADNNLKFLSKETPVSKNGAADVIQCVAIEQLRKNQPTAFSNINFEMITSYGEFCYEVQGLNFAEAVYEEVYEVDNVRYHLYCESDKPENVLFVCYEIIQ